MDGDEGLLVLGVVEGCDPDVVGESEGDACVEVVARGVDVVVVDVLLDKLVALADGGVLMSRVAESCCDLSSVSEIISENLRKSGAERGSYSGFFRISSLKFPLPYSSISL